MADLNLTRRNMLKGTAALALTHGWLPTALANQQATLQAAISGYGVMNTFDPGKSALVPEAYIIYGVFNGLLGFDPDMNLKPELAESWGVADDGSIQFKLRKDVKFHNGQAFSADDVAFTLERIMDPDFASPSRNKLESIDRIEIVDPHTIKLHTKRPYVPLLSFLTNSRTGTQIVPAKTVKEMGADAFGKSPIGTGAYKLKQWTPGQNVLLVANPDYFGGQPFFQNVEVPLIPEESSGVTALLGEQIDFTSTAPFSQIPELQKNSAVTVYKQPGLNTRFISLNMKKTPADNVHFRRALSMAFQREAMVKVVLFGEGKPMNGYIPPSLKQFYDEAPHQYTTFNPEQARAELEKSGWDKSQPLAVVTWGAGWWKRIAELFVAQVNATLGTKLTVEVTDPNAAYARQKSGDFTLAVWGWLGMSDPDEYLRELFHTDGWRNYGGYSNPDIDKVLEAAAAELDTAKRVETYQQAQNAILNDMPVIPCFCSNIHNLSSSKIEGFNQKPYSNFGDQFVNMRPA